MTAAIEKFTRANVPYRWYLRRGLFYQDLGNSEAAEADWDKALEVGYRRSEVLSIKARMHEEQRNIAQALDAAREAIALDPDNRTAKGVIERLAGED